MFCGNCGKPTNEGDKVCGFCGTPIESANQEIPASNQAVENQVNMNNFAANDFVTPDFDEGKKKSPKNRKKLIIAASIGAAVAIVAALVAFNFEFLQGHFIKMFGTDEEYYHFVEKKAITEGTDAFVNGYGRIIDAFTDGVSGEGSVSFEVDESALDLVEDYVKFGKEADDIINIINNLKLNMASNQKEGVSQATIGVELAGEELIALDVIGNMLDGEMYVGAPDLADGYLAGELPMSKAQKEIYEIFYSPELWDALPSDGDLEDLLDKYIDAALAGIDDVDMEDGEIEVDGVSEDCTVIEYDISEKTICNIAISALEAIKEDGELEDLVNNFNDYADDELPVSEKDMYGVIEEHIDEAIDELEEISDEASDKAVCTMVVYVNSSHEVIGREVVAKDYKGNKREVLSIKTAEDGGEFATEIKVMGETIIEGEGEKSGDEIEKGTYDVIVYGKKFVEIELIEFDASGLNEGELYGTIRLSPGKDLLKEIVGSSSMAGMIKSLDLALSIDIDSDGDSSEMTLAILQKEDPLVSIIIEQETSSGDSVDIPDDIYDGEDNDEIEEFIETIDIDEFKDTLEDSLEDADVSSKTIKSVIDLIEEFEDEMF